MELTVSELHRFRETVRELAAVGHGDENSLLAQLGVEEKLRHRFCRFAVEVSRGLVAKEKARPANECSRDRNPLLLAAGELRGAVVQSMLQADPTEQIHGSLTVLPSRGHERGSEDVLENAQLRQETVVLEDKADVLAPERRESIRGEGERIRFSDLHRASRRLVERSEKKQQRALPSSGGPHDGKGVALVEGEREAAKDVQRSRRSVIVLDEPLDFEQR